MGVVRRNFSGKRHRADLDLDVTRGAQKDAFLRFRAQSVDRVAHTLGAEREPFSLRLKVMEVKGLKVARIPADHAAPTRLPNEYRFDFLPVPDDGVRSTLLAAVITPSFDHELGLTVALATHQGR